MVIPLDEMRLTEDEAARLRVGINVIVRTGDQIRYWRHSDLWTVPLHKACSVCRGMGDVGFADSFGSTACEQSDCDNGRVLIGRGTVVIVPIVTAESFGRHLLITALVVAPDRVTLVRSVGPILQIDIDPTLLAPGRDFGIVIDCAEVVTP